MRRTACSVGLMLLAGSVLGCQDPNEGDDMQDGGTRTALMPPDFYTDDPADAAPMDDYPASDSYTSFPADTSLAAGGGSVQASWNGGGQSNRAVGGSTSGSPQMQSMTPAGSGATHRVAKGDTLYRLARLYYNDVHRWKDIYTANRAQLPNPNMIKVGQELVIP